MLKLTIDQKYLRKFFISRLKILLIRFYQQNSVDLEKTFNTTCTSQFPEKLAKVFR